MAVVSVRGELARNAEPVDEEPAVIDVAGLRMRYGSVGVLQGVDFTVAWGEVVVLLGPNGAGKTTIIEILEGFRMRSAGEVGVLGVDPARAGEHWRASIGIVLQSWRDHGKWKVHELLAHLGRYYAPYSTPRRPRPRDVDELIETVGLGDRASVRIARLSGGERRWLDLAIGIIGCPDVLFLDEPTAGLDPVARRGFHDLVHRLSDLEDTTILLTTHDLDEAEKLADRILILDGGRTEFRHSLSRPDEYGFDLLVAGVILTVLYFQRDNPVAGTTLSLATLVLPGVVGMMVAFNPLLFAALAVAVEREDGTLLRAKAAPFGVVGYLTGQVVRIPLTSLRGLLLVLVPGLFIVDGLASTEIGRQKAAQRIG